MSVTQENNPLAMDITTSSKLNDFFQALEEADVFNIVDSITFDVKSQTLIFHMQKLLKKEAEEVHRHHSGETDLADAKIIKLSECYKHRYPELLENFKEWKPCRETLINILNSSSDSLERNSAFVSAFRVLTSAADIFGTLARSGGEPEFSWADFAMEHASTFGVIALFVEMTLAKKMLNDVKKAIRKDQKIFEKIIQWFKQTEELDAAIKSFFPYGIDVDIVKKISTCSENFDDYNKMFMSIVASNVKQNVKLFKNKEFLDKADRVASSEAGQQWFHKVILENDPCFKHCLNSNLCDEIQDLLKISPTENREIYVDACRILSSKVKLKVTLNVITIISAGSNLLFGAKPEESEDFRKLSETTKEELEKIQKVVSFLKPSEFEMDPVLEQ